VIAADAARGDPRPLQEGSQSLLVVANPTRTPAGFDAAGALRRTRGDGGDVERIAGWLCERPQQLVVAAGGDGTARAVAAALMTLPAAERPALGLVPLGTANNLARSLGLRRVRRDAAALAAALTALRRGTTRPLDLGRVNGTCFVGSCAAGMDGAILATRNRWRARWRLRGGYPLYLASCAANLLRHRPTTLALSLDGGAAVLVPAHNLLVLNTALYAGEFRFDSTDRSADGRLDLLVAASAVAYVRDFVSAWGRRLGAPVGAAGLRPFTTARIEAETPLALQVDGEELAPTRTLEVVVESGCLRVVVPSIW